MPPRDGELQIGVDRWAQRSNTAAEAGANPVTLAEFSSAGLERSASLWSVYGDLCTALANYRSQLAFASAEVEEIDWNVGHHDNGDTVEDQVDELIRNWEHLDGFVGQVADAFFAAEGLDSASAEADRVFTVPIGELLTHGRIGFAGREDALAEAERLADELANLEGASVEELNAWVAAVTVGQHDTTFAVAFSEAIGVEGFETAPALFESIYGSTDAAQPALDQALVTLGTTLDSAVDSRERDHDSAYVDPANATLDWDQRLDAGFWNDLTDHPEVAEPYAGSTPITAATLDAARIEHLLADVDTALPEAHDDGHGSMRLDPNEVEELAALYPDLTDVLESAGPLLENEAYAVKLVNELGADNSRLMLDLTNTFGVAYNEGLLDDERIEPPAAALSEAPSDNGIFVPLPPRQPTFYDRDRDPYEGYVMPLASLYGTADRSGRMDEAVRESLVNVDPRTLDHPDVYDETLIAMGTQRERTGALLLNAGDFSPETTAQMAEAVISFNDLKYHTAVSGDPITGWSLTDLEGFTERNFLDREGRYPLAGSQVATYHALGASPEAAAIFFSNPANTRRAMHPALVDQLPRSDSTSVDNEQEVVAERLDQSESDVEDRHQRAIAGAFEAGLTSNDVEHREQAMVYAIGAVSGLDELENEYLLEAFARGFGANTEYLAGRLGDWSPTSFSADIDISSTLGELDEANVPGDVRAIYGYLGVVMRDDEAAVEIYDSVLHHFESTVTRLPAGVDISNVESWAPEVTSSGYLMSLAQAANINGLIHDGLSADEANRRQLELLDRIQSAVTDGGGVVADVARAHPYVGGSLVAVELFSDATGLSLGDLVPETHNTEEALGEGYDLLAAHRWSLRASVVQWEYGSGQLTAEELNLQAARAAEDALAALPGNVDVDTSHLDFSNIDLTVGLRIKSVEDMSDAELVAYVVWVNGLHSSTPIVDRGLAAADEVRTRFGAEEW